MTTPLAPPPKKADIRFDDWITRLWKRLTSTTSGELGLGTMADQDADAVAITGGTGTFTGDVTLNTANSGGTTSLTIKNTSNTANSDSRLVVQSGGATGGDAYFSCYNIAALKSFGMKPNDTAFYVGANSPTVGPNHWVFASTGSGYPTGVGGTVTQATSRTTGVTLNKPTGSITLVSAAGSATWQSFTLTNSTIAATDTVRVCQKSGTDLYQIHVTAVAAGSCRITFATTGGTTTEQPVFNFAVLKGATS